MNKNELDKTIEDYKEALAEARSINKANGQNVALADKPTEKRSVTVWADVQKSMKEGRAITVNGTGDVSVSHNLIYALQDKTDLLKEFSFTAGGAASQIIPVWNNSLAEFVPVEEGGTFATNDGAMTAINLMPNAFANSIKITDETLKLSAVNFESQINKIISDSLSRTILRQIFNGTGRDGNFKAITDGATVKTTSKWDAAALQNFVLTTVLTKTDSAKIFMNPSVYAAIADGTGNKDKILQEQISKREIEGVKIVLSNFVPADVYAIATDPSNYGVGVADELKIIEKPIANSLVHQYDCSAYLCGSPIVAKDNFVLKAE